jgi:adenine-specific DNA-methyltransferase
VRYIGNKTRLLGFIRRVMRARGITSGTAIDPFSGSASVARALKRWGFRTTAADIMEYGYVFGRAYVEVPDEPDFTRLIPTLSKPRCDLRSVLSFLERIPLEPSFIHEHYSPAGHEGSLHDRMYYLPATAARIDSIRIRIEEWYRSELIDRDGYHVLLASLIEGADRVANTTGVYASWVKAWQPNSKRSFRMRFRPPIVGPGCQAVRADALDLIRDAGPFDVLYLDPPYNDRQYPGYYHIPELLATGWFDAPVITRGKTGLIVDKDTRSDWSSRRRCAPAFEELLATAQCKHIVMSYNAEGLIRTETIERMLKKYGIASTYRRYRHRHRRYRSAVGGETPHTAAEDVSEYLYCVSR